MHWVVAKKVNSIRWFISGTDKGRAITAPTGTRTFGTDSNMTMTMVQNSSELVSTCDDACSSTFKISVGATLCAA